MERLFTSPVEPANRPADVEAWLRQLTPAEAADFGPQFPAAVQAVRRAGRSTPQVLETHLHVSYCRAARMVDAIERLGLMPPTVHRPRRNVLFMAAGRRAA